MTTYKKKSRSSSGVVSGANQVTQQGGTEAPFQKAYWNHNEPGLYVDVVSGEPLLTSFDKFDSDCGWPSFTRPVEAENVEEKHDNGLGMARIEVRSTHSENHLGHLFDDGPQETGGLRYCINSASLRFIPLDELESQGYGDYLKHFEPQKRN